MKSFQSKSQLFLIALLILLLVIVGRWGWTTYRAVRMTQQFAAVQQHVKIPTDIHFVSKSFTSYSEQGLPHYAPFAVYDYTYDRAHREEVRAAILEELRSDGYSITGNDVSTQRQLNFDWYIYGKNSASKSEVHFDAWGNNIAEKICQIDACY